MWNGAVCEEHWLQMESVEQIYLVKKAESELQVFKRKNQRDLSINDTQHEDDFN